MARLQRVRCLIVYIQVATVLSSPLLRQPVISGTSNLAVNPGLVGVRVGLGVRSGSIYGTQALVADGGIVKIQETRA